jgi:hypothetical protein
MREFLAAMLIVVVVLGIVFGPLAVIWALNTLFPVLAIPHTFKTWLAILVLSAVLTPFKVTTKS